MQGAWPCRLTIAGAADGRHKAESHFKPLLTAVCKHAGHPLDTDEAAHRLVCEPMNLDQLAIFHLASRRVDYLGQRQTVLAANIANADTPGYMAHDLQPFAEYVEDGGVNRLPPTRTHPLHLVGFTANAGDARNSVMNDLYEAAPSGNEVVLEQQMIAVADTAAQHQLAVNLYRKHIGMLQMAIGRNR